MRQTLLICKRGLGLLFRSPLAYVILTLYFLCSGFFFYHITLEQAVSLEAMQAGGNAPAAIFREFWRTSGWILLFTAPIISMGSLAGEKAKGTIELLLTSPLRLGHLLVGKYLSLVIFLLVILAPAWVYFAFLRLWTGTGYGQFFTGFIGAFLLGAAAMAVGLLVSALSRSQIIAGFGAFGCLLIFWFIDAASTTLPGVWRGFVRYFSLHHHYHRLITADVRLDAIAYFISFVVFFLFAAHLLTRILWRRGQWG